MKIGRFDVHPLAAKFPLIKGVEFANLTKSVDENGLREPIVLAPGGDMIVDGVNRMRACIEAKRDPIFETLHDGCSDEQIVEIILDANVRRRHLEKGWLGAFVVCEIEPYLKTAAKERQRAAGGDQKSADRSIVPKVTPPICESGKTREQAAALVGVSNGTVAKAERVNRVAPELLNDVLAGKLKLDEANKQAKVIEKAHTPEPKTTPSRTTITLLTHLGDKVEYPLPKAKPAFNPTNDFIGWAAWSWNPVTGCLHSCREYCYANELANRPSYAKAYPVGFTPLFHRERLDAPANAKVPDDAIEHPTRGRVFVCSMADLYGKWVPEEWIAQVHAACVANPQWQYLMLTKFPERYVGRRDLPATAWLGTSVDTQKRVRVAETAFSKIKGVKVKWLSLEPLLEPLEFKDLSMFDWIVIGSKTETRQPGGISPAFAPPFEWVARIVDQAREAGCKIFLKQNLIGETSGQAPGMILPQESPDK